MSISADIKYGESIPLLYISNSVLFKPGYLLSPVLERTLQNQNILWTMHSGIWLKTVIIAERPWRKGQIIYPERPAVPKLPFFISHRIWPFDIILQSLQNVAYMSRDNYFMNPVKVLAKALTGTDSTNAAIIFKNTTTLLSLWNMFWCFKHHLQPYKVQGSYIYQFTCTLLVLYLVWLKMMFETSKHVPQT